MTNNVAGALAYVVGLLTGILFLVLEPYNKDRFVRFHAFQSIFFSIAWCVLWFVLQMFFWIMVHIIGPFGLLAVPLYGLLGLGGFIFWLFLMFQAYNNKEFKIPFIGELAAKQAGA